jgi:hypothetical protein
LLEVQGYDIVLGTDWLYTHSPVGLDLKTRTFSITKDGQELLTLVDESQPSKHVTISAKKMCHLIRKHEIVTVLVLSNGFEKEVAALPPQQQLLTVKIRQPSHEFTFGVGMSFIPYPLVLTPVV